MITRIKCVHGQNSYKYLCNTYDDNLYNSLMIFISAVNTEF